VATGDGTGARVYDAATGQVLVVAAEKTAVRALAWSPDGSRLAISNEQDVMLHDAVSGRPAVRLADEAVVRAVAFSPDGDRLLTVTGTKAHIWDTRTQTVIHALTF
jgi:WD40 repeat protein